MCGGVTSRLVDRCFAALAVADNLAGKHTDLLGAFGRASESDLLKVAMLERTSFEGDSLRLLSSRSIHRDQTACIDSCHRCSDLSPPATIATRAGAKSDRGKTKREGKSIGVMNMA